MGWSNDTPSRQTCTYGIIVAMRIYEFEMKDEDDDTKLHPKTVRSLINCENIKSKIGEY